MRRFEFILYVFFYEVVFGLSVYGFGYFQAMPFSLLWSLILGAPAVVLLMQGGMESGNALADILTGKVNPSGRLADTWAYKYDDYPSSDTFSERNPEMLQEDYREGIFVGYRWFDKKSITPRYKFGYGLSYTTFKTEADYCANRGTKISVNVRVTNTGDMAGKEVSMLYLSCPENRIIRFPEGRGL